MIDAEGRLVLADVLSLLEAEGFVLQLGQQVHIRPEWLVALLKPLADHEPGEAPDFYAPGTLVGQCLVVGSRWPAAATEGGSGSTPREERDRGRRGRRMVGEQRS